MKYYIVREKQPRPVERLELNTLLPIFTGAKSLSVGRVLAWAGASMQGQLDAIGGIFERKKEMKDEGKKSVWLAVLLQ